MTELLIILSMFVIVIGLICAMGFVRLNKNEKSENVKVEAMRIESIVEPITE